MPKVETKDIRNIVLVDHNSSGKTMLGDAMLFKGKASARLGSVEDGTSVFDFLPEEKDRKNSIDLAVASVSVQGKEINILDAPSYPVVDVEGEVYDGSFHHVDSGPASFELAGSKAFMDAFAKSKPVILEPIVHIETTVPSRFMGDITGDLNSRRGRIEGMDSQGALQVVRAHISMMEIMDYETPLRSVTGGEGSYVIEPSHYDVMPHKRAEAVIAKAKKPDEEEE